MLHAHWRFQFMTKYYFFRVILITICISFLSNTVIAAGNGLQASYWNYDVAGNGNVMPSTRPDLTRIEPMVNFNWGRGSPAPSIHANYFAAKWEGDFITQEEGDYIFFTRSDDGIRLWIDNVLVVSRWSPHGATWDEASPIHLLAATKYSIRVEFFERRGGAIAELYWQLPNSSKKTIVPESSLFSKQEPRVKEISAPNPCLTNNLIMHFNLDMKSGSDANSVENIANYSISPQIPVGLNIVSAVIDSGDSSKVTLTLDQTLDLSTNYTVTASHIVTTTGEQLISSSSSITLGAGVNARYWNSKTIPLSSPILVRVEPNIDHDWGGGSPDPLINQDKFSARWDADFVAPRTGNYTFRTRNDDGARVWIDDNLIIDHWRNSNTTQTSGIVPLTAGQYYSIKVEYYENRGGARMHVFWRYPGSSGYEIIPPAAFSLCYVPPSLSPVAEYRFEEKNSWNGTFGEVYDQTTNNHLGQAGGTVGMAGKVENELLNHVLTGDPGTCHFSRFEASGTTLGQVVTVPYNSDLNPDNFSVTFWAKPGVDNRGRWNGIVSSGDWRVGTGYNIYIDSGRRWNFATSQGVRGREHYLNSGSLKVDYNEWSHIAVTFEKISTSGGIHLGRKKLYVNGHLVANESSRQSKYKPNTTERFIMGSSVNNGLNRWFYDGDLDEVRVYNGTLTTAKINIIKDETHPCSSVVVNDPSNFNCFESSMAGGAVSGPLYTKLAGTNFSFDVVALKDDPASGTIPPAQLVLDDFESTGSATGAVTVELVEASNNALACDAYPALNPAISQPLTFIATNLGKKTTAIFNSAKAYKNLKCRVSYDHDANATTDNIIGCSTDEFAIRPMDFTITAQKIDNTPLNNATDSGEPKEIAGDNFKLIATTNIVNYDGTPIIDNAAITAHSGFVQTGTLLGLFPLADNTTGNATGSAFSYSEVGNFTIDSGGVVDSSYTAIDQFTGCVQDSASNTAVDGMYGCNIINSTASSAIGRFIPAYFDFSNESITPACDTFSYMGQEFNAGFTLTAKNRGGDTTQNYNYHATTNFVKATDVEAKSEYVLSSGSTNLNARISLVYDNTDWVNGQYVFNDTMEFSRSAFPDGAYDDPESSITDDGLHIGVIVTDSDGVMLNSPDMLSIDNTDCVVGNTCVENRIGTTDLRFGRLVIDNAYGSELAPLAVPMYTEYYNGSDFVLNADDVCTTVTTSQLLYNAGTSPVTVGTETSTSTIANSPLVAGLAGLEFSEPGDSGSINITSGSFITAFPWLGFDWNSDGVYDNAPEATATFGLFKGSSKQIFFREVY